MKSFSRSAVATVEIEAPAEVEVEAAPAAEDPLYPVALLKIAMAMKQGHGIEERRIDDLLDRVLEDLVVDPEAFEAYLRRNLGLLEATVRRQGY